MKHNVTEKDLRQIIEDFWWETYGRSYKKMNQRTREELEALAKKLYIYLYE